VAQEGDESPLVIEDNFGKADHRLPAGRKMNIRKPPVDRRPRLHAMYKFASCYVLASLN
jgi:hypothetical protein